MAAIYPEFVRVRLLVAGVGYYGNPFGKLDEWSDETEIDSLWRRYAKTLLASKGIDAVDTGYGYEILIESDETVQTGYHEVFVGQRIANNGSVPFQLCTKILPEAIYACFTLGFEVSEDWYAPILDEWLPASGYRRAGSYLVIRRSIEQTPETGLLRCGGDTFEAWLPVAED